MLAAAVMAFMATGRSAASFPGTQYRPATDRCPSAIGRCSGVVVLSAGASWSEQGCRRGPKRQAGDPPPQAICSRG